MNSRNGQRRIFESPLPSPEAEGLQTSTVIAVEVRQYDVVDRVGIDSPSRPGSSRMDRAVNQTRTVEQDVAIGSVKQGAGPEVVARERISDSDDQRPQLVRSCCGTRRAHREPPYLPESRER